ncbi:MAG: zinc-binding dehydrogenase [Chloroflexi bacterium]|nr:zinc-binding dehydrogenase [Chloroflexota bacterium]
MRAIQLTAPGQFTIVEVPVPTPGPEEVLVKVAACNTCPQWDLSLWRGIDLFEREGQPTYPQQVGWPGHEMAGVVVAAGSAVQGLRVGDRVANWNISPQSPNQCYAEYVALPAELVLPIPDHLPFEEAASLELLTCLATSILRAGEVVGKRVGVSGLGPAGLLAVQALKARGAREVVGFDPIATRCTLACQLGADRALVPGGADWQELTRSEHQLDLSLDCVGVADSVNGLLQVTRERVIIFGVPHGPITFTRAAWSKGLSLEGYGRRSRLGAEYALHLLASGQVTTRPLVSAVLPFEEYDRGIQLLSERAAIKVCFTP